MGKKTVSFYLDSDLIDFITEYKESNGLNSESSALNRILLTNKIYMMNTIERSREKESVQVVNKPKQSIESDIMTALGLL